MSDEQVQKTDDERLKELKVELSKHYGKLTRWRAACQEQTINSLEDQIRLAEEVLAAPTTGTNAEWLTHHLRLKGGKSFDVDEMLARSDAASGKDGA